ncbi:MAG: hypothetical protein ACRDHY_16150 [Anaerolineales bacterium]
MALFITGRLPTEDAHFAHRERPDRSTVNAKIGIVIGAGATMGVGG